MGEESLLTVQEAAGFLGCSIHSVYRWTAQGVLPVVKVGRLSRFRPADLRAWVAARTGAV